MKKAKMAVMLFFLILSVSMLYSAKKEEEKRGFLVLQCYYDGSYNSLYDLETGKQYPIKSRAYEDPTIKGERFFVYDGKYYVLEYVYNKKWKAKVDSSILSCYDIRTGKKEMGQTFADDLRSIKGLNVSVNGVYVNAYKETVKDSSKPNSLYNSEGKSTILQVTEQGISIIYQMEGVYPGYSFGVIDNKLYLNESETSWDSNYKRSIVEYDPESKERRIIDEGYDANYSSEYGKIIYIPQADDEMNMKIYDVRTGEYILTKLPCFSPSTGCFIDEENVVVQQNQKTFWNYMRWSRIVDLKLVLYNIRTGRKRTLLRTSTTSSFEGGIQYIDRKTGELILEANKLYPDKKPEKKKKEKSDGVRVIYPDE